MKKNSDKKTIAYADDDGSYKFSFTHKDLPQIPANLRDEFEEAVARFGSLLVENIDHMDKYKESGYPKLSGIINTIKKLKEANETEDKMSDITIKTK